MENLNTIKPGEIFTPPEMSTNFYARMQAPLVLLMQPQALVALSEENLEAYVELVKPVFEYMASIEQHLKDLNLVDEKGGT